jgi:hypothetical protein
VVAGDGDLDLGARHDLTRLPATSDQALIGSESCHYDGAVVDRGGGPWNEALGKAPDLAGPGRTSFAARLDRFVADARVQDAAAARTRERFLLEVAEQEATLHGVLCDLAERGSHVSVEVGDRRHQGSITGVGVDFLALQVIGGPELLLASSALTLIRAASGRAPSVGDRAPSTELRLADLLHELAADRERVRLVTVSGTVLTGQLRSVGHDVAVVRLGSPDDGSVHVPLRAIAEVALA